MAQPPATKMAVSGIMGASALLWFVFVVFGFNVFDAFDTAMAAVLATALLGIGLYDIAASFGISSCSY